MKKIFTVSLIVVFSFCLVSPGLAEKQEEKLPDDDSIEQPDNCDYQLSLNINLPEIFESGFEPQHPEKVKRKEVGPSFLLARSRLDSENESDSSDEEQQEQAESTLAN